MAITRRGVFFTVMSLLLVAFLLTSQSITTNSYTSTKADAEAARARISLLNRYTSTFEQNAQNSLRFAGYNALQNLSLRVGANREYIRDMNASITFCLNNKTNGLNCLNANQTINASIDKLVRIASTNMSITTTYNIDRVWISEERPLEVILWMNISYNISDPFASWQTHSTVQAVVDVSGIQDPLFQLAAGNGEYSADRPFKLMNTRGGFFNNSTFTQYYLAQEYLPTPIGRSVLQRFTGNTSLNSSCCGVESVVSSAFVSASLKSDPQWVNWSSVDYLFFARSTNTYDCTNTIAQLTGDDFPDHYVRLDREHLYNVYRLNGSANYTCTS